MQTKEKPRKPVRMIVNIPLHMEEAIDSIAEQYADSKSGVVRRMILSGIEDHMNRNQPGGATNG